MSRAPEFLVGRYRVIRTLGQGGMGEVLLVEDTVAGGCRVALKRARGEQLFTAGPLERLRREFSLLADLRHPNLVQVLDLGWLEQGQGYYYTMELVEGEDLLALARVEPPGAILDLMAQVCRGLAYLHWHGLLHRDLKPSNILLTPQRVAKLADFGLLCGPLEVPEALRQGTLSYMAPEVLAGGMPDVRSDLFSLGVTFYELLCGQLPFAGSTPAELREAHELGPPRPAVTLRQDLPDGVEALLQRLLARDPAERCSSAREVLEILSTGCGVSCPMDLPETTGASLRTGELVGRERLLEELLVTWRYIEATGRPAITRLRGPEGVGRTRLQEALDHQLRAVGVLVLRGQPGSGPVGGLEPALAQALRLGELEEGSSTRTLLESLLAGSSPDARLAFGAGAHLLRALARSHSLALLVDDVGEVGPQALGFLEVLINRLREVLASGEQARLWLVVVERLDDENPLELPDQEWSLQHQLQPFSREQVGQMVELILGQAVSPELVTALHQESGGLPQAVEEILRILLEQGSLTRSEEGWNLEGVTPRALRALGPLTELTRDRLHALQGPARRVALALALHAQATEEAVLSPVCQLETDQLRGVLRDLVRRGVASPDPAAPDRWRIGPAALGRELTAHATEEEQERLHDRFARILEAQGRGGSPVQVLHRLRGADPARGAGEALRCAQHLLAEDRPIEARDLLREALLRAEDRMPASESARASLLLARILVREGRSEEASHLFARAREDGDVSVRTQATLGPIMAQAMRGRLEGLPRVRQELRAELAAADLPETERRAELIRVDLTCIRGWIGARETEEPRRLLRELEPVIETSSLDLQADYLDARCRLLFLEQRWEELLDAGERLVQVHRERGVELDPLSEPRRWVATARSGLGDLQAGIDYWLGRADWARQRFRPVELAVATLNAGLLTQQAGAHPRAHQLLVEAERAGKTCGRPFVRVSAELALSRLESGRGHYGDALRRVKRARELAAQEGVRDVEGHVLLAEAELYLALGALDRCELTIRDAARQAATPESTFARAVTMVLMRLALRQEDLHTAEELLTQLTAADDQHGPQQLWEGLPLDRAELRLAQGRLAEAEDELREIGLRLDATPYHQMRATSRLLLGRCLRRATPSRAEEALAILEQGLAELGELTEVELRAELLVEMAEAARELHYPQREAQFTARARALYESALVTITDPDLRRVYRKCPWRSSALDPGRIPTTGERRVRTVGGREGTDGPPSLVEILLTQPLLHEELLRLALELTEARGGELLVQAGSSAFVPALHLARGGKLHRAQGTTPVPRAQVERAWQLRQPVWSPAASGQPDTLAIPLTSVTSAQEGVVLLLEAPAEQRVGEQHLRTVQTVLLRLQGSAQLLQQLALDRVTGVRSRRGLTRHLRGLPEDGRVPVAVIAVGLLGFDAQRWRAGPQQEDAILRLLANLIRQNVRIRDSIYRYSEDVFLLLLPGLTVTQALPIGERLHRILSGHPTPGDLRLDAVLGLAACPGDASTASGAVRWALQALVAARREGNPRMLCWRQDLAGARLDPVAELVTGEAARDQRNMRLLLDSLDLVRQGPDRETLLRRVAEHALEQSGAERCLVLVGEELELAQVRHRPGLGRVMGEEGWSVTLARRCLQSGQSLHHADRADQTESFSVKTLRELQLRTVQCAPLLGASSTLGVIYLDEHVSAGHLHERDLGLLQALGQELGEALEAQLGDRM